MTHVVTIMNRTKVREGTYIYATDHVQVGKIDPNIKYLKIKMDMNF